MKYRYQPRGVCSREIIIDVDETTQIINDICFIGGCSGNTQGVAALAKGRKLGEVIGLIKGIDCAGRGTSCPDQLAQALEAIQEEL